MNFLHDILGDSSTAVLLSGALIIIGAWLLGRVLRLGIDALRTRLAHRTRSSLDDYILAVLGRNITGLLVFFSAYWVLHGMLPLVPAGDPGIATLLGAASETAFIVMVLYGAFVLSRFVDALVRWYLKDVADRTDTRLDDELAPLVNRILHIIVYTLGIIVVLNHFNQDISTLVVSLGVGSLAIALAAQETLANMIAGFVLMIDRPFRPGDRIRLPDGSIGNVQEIGIRSTKVIDDNFVMVITPNAEIVKSQIKNYSYPNDIVRFQTAFSVAYGTDLGAMQRLIVDTLNREPDIVDPDATEVRIVALADSSVNCEANCRIRNPNLIPRRRSELTKLIYDTLRANAIGIPYPQRVVHMAPPHDPSGAGR